MYGEGAVTERVVYKTWLDEAPQPGRPVDSDQTETLIENNQCYIMQEIANILKISKLVTLMVKMKNMSFIFMKNLNGHFGQLNI